MQSGTPCACLCVLRQGAATVHTFSLTVLTIPVGFLLGMVGCLLGAWLPTTSTKPVPGHLGISFAFGAFTVALACQKLLLLRCYLRPSGSYQPYGKFQPRCPCKCLGLHFKWCKYLMPLEVISRMESPSQDALASLAIKVQLSFFLLRLTTTI